MKQDANVKKWGRWTAVFAVMTMGFVACSSADGTGQDGTTDDVDSTSSALWGGYVTEGCNAAQVQKIHDAVGVLLRAGSTGYSAYKSCLVGAALLENKCVTGATIAEYVKRDDVAKIKCADLAPEKGGNAPVGISGERLTIDRKLVNTNTAHYVAGVILHELMHNRGFDHVENPYPNKYFAFTVPEQARACLGGKANPWPFPGSAPAQTCARKCPTARPFCCEPLANGECIVCAVDARTCP